MSQAIDTGQKSSFPTLNINFIKAPDRDNDFVAKDIKEYALSVGYTPEEVGSLVDHRSLLVLIKAQKYDSLHVRLLCWCQKNVKPSVHLNILL